MEPDTGDGDAQAIIDQIIYRLPLKRNAGTLGLTQPLADVYLYRSASL
jgi:hypothetical protein